MAARGPTPVPAPVSAETTIVQLRTEMVHMLGLIEMMCKTITQISGRIDGIEGRLRIVELETQIPRARLQQAPPMYIDGRVLPSGQPTSLNTTTPSS